MLISNEELNKKRNYVLVCNSHERYAFETSFNIYRNTSLKEIINEYDLMHPDVYRPGEHSYESDECRHSELDTKYTYKDYPSDKLQQIHIESYFIFDLDLFLETGEQSYVWCSTENKYGLLDVKRKEDKE